MASSEHICDCMNIFVVFLFMTMSTGHSVDPVKSRCPTDYRRRVETCIMEAQLAPQAGGGITLVLNKDTIVSLCDRGILRKTIDSLDEIHSRCVQNSTVLQELDRLYSVPSWQEGARIICEDTMLFQNNFECLHRAANSVTSCVLMRTHSFRMGLAFTDPSDHASVRDVTCSFAQSIVKCLCSPLKDHCPGDLTKRVAKGMRHFLPPLCVAESLNHDSDDAKQVPTTGVTNTTITTTPTTTTSSTTTTTTTTRTTTTTTSTSTTISTNNNSTINATSQPEMTMSMAEYKNKEEDNDEDEVEDNDEDENEDNDKDENEDNDKDEDSDEEVEE